MYKYLGIFGFVFLFGFNVGCTAVDCVDRNGPDDPLCNPEDYVAQLSKKSLSLSGDSVTIGIPKDQSVAEVNYQTASDFDVVMEQFGPRDIWISFKDDPSIVTNRLPSEVHLAFSAKQLSLRGFVPGPVKIYLLSNGKHVTFDLLLNP